MRPTAKAVAAAILFAAALGGPAFVETARAQAPGTVQITAAEFAALAAKAKADIKPGQPNLVRRALGLAPYAANMEYRPASVPQAAATHMKEAELFYVVEGSGTLVTGGKLTNQTAPNADNFSGTGIEGGVAKPVAKGDIIFVPENTPHWFSRIDQTLVLMSLHVPRPVPAG